MVRRRHRSITPSVPGSITTYFYYYCTGGIHTRTHTHTTIFPSRLPTFRHLPRTTATQSGHRRVIAAAVQQQPARSCQSVLCYYKILRWRRRRWRRGSRMGVFVVEHAHTRTRARGTSSARVYGSLYDEPVFPIAVPRSNAAVVSGVSSSLYRVSRRCIRTPSDSC